MAIIGQSPQVTEVRDMIARLSATSCTVLLVGETGTGKDVVAHAIHESSSSREGPFVPVDCGALAVGMMESEVFGHTRDAYTGATETTEGLFRSANGGTLFLDEIDELPVQAQAKLLRLIQDKMVRQVGSVQFSRTNVRLIAATNRNPQLAMLQGVFRHDLYYRLAVVEIEMPPLRDRREDIPMLVEHFVAKHLGPGGTPLVCGPKAWARLLAHNWPGNVRELENCVIRALALGVEPTPEAMESTDLFSGAVNPRRKVHISVVAPAKLGRAVPFDFRDYPEKPGRRGKANGASASQQQAPSTGVGAKAVGRHGMSSIRFNT